MNTQEIRGRRTRPRLGVVGYWSEEEQAAIARLAPSVTFHATLPKLEEAWSRSDLDVVVIGETEARSPDLRPAGTGRGYRPTLNRLQDVHLVLFGLPSVDNVPFHHGREVLASKAAASSEFTVPPRTGALARLLESSLRTMDDVRGWTTLTLSRRLALPPGTTAPTEAELERSRLMQEAAEPFARAALFSAKVPDAPLAVATVRADTSTGFAWFPNVHTDRVRWLDALLLEWAELDREAFKGVIPWREQRRWLTAAELALTEALDAVREERARETARLLAEEDRIELELAAARANADRTERLLLTAQGDELVAAVARAFAAIGFDVQDMDAAKGAGEARLEDLRLRLRGRNGWEAIVEVKGHEKRGLRLADLNQARRPRDRYRDENDRWPDLVMVVHNGSAASAPDLRPRPFETSAADARSLEQEGYWLVVPTTDLYRLLRDAPARGQAAVELLADTRGVFSYPEP